MGESDLYFHSNIEEYAKTVTVPDDLQHLVVEMDAAAIKASQANDENCQDPVLDLLMKKRQRGQFFRLSNCGMSSEGCPWAMHSFSLSDATELHFSPKEHTKERLDRLKCQTSQAYKLGLNQYRV